MITATVLVCEKGVVFIYSGKILDPKYCKPNYKTSLLEKSTVSYIINYFYFEIVLYFFFFVLIYEIN